MAFFGFSQPDLEADRKKFAQSAGQDDSLPVYNWGEDDYDGLGDALVERGDELNVETFGDTGEIGKDFDFSAPVLPTSDIPDEWKKLPPKSAGTPNSALEARQSPSIQSNSLEALWHDKSSFLGLNRNLSGSRQSYTQSPKPPPSAQAQAQTLQDIEREMRLQAQVQHAQQLQQQRLDEEELYMLAKRQQQERLYQQQQQQQQQQRQAETRELLQQQRLRQQEQQNQLQRLWEHQQMQQYQNLPQRTPPPRMLQNQSPRFADNTERQRLLLLQQQQQQQDLYQQQQQQQRLQEIEEQLRMEELERQLRTQHLSQLNQHRDATNGVNELLALQAALRQQQQQQQQRRPRSMSPAYIQQQENMPLQQNLQNIPRNHPQQRLLNEMAQAELIRELQGGPPIDQEALRSEAMRKILEAERAEDKRRRKAAKIAHMSRYNDLMTQSDKDFITRIQVSQLVTQDPYAEDFYAQVYNAIQRSREGEVVQDRVLRFGNGGGVGLGVEKKGLPQRRSNAMQRMEQQVERIVNNARIREKEKDIHAPSSLQGALGKTSGRSYKAAPRQLLQVDSTNASTSPTLSHTAAHISKEDAPQSEHAAEAAKLGREALGPVHETVGLVKMDPLDNRQVLIKLEGLYDLLLKIEQFKREQPPEEDEIALDQWDIQYNEMIDQLYDGMAVMVPLETSNPHPFISLLTPTKGKRFMPRISRHLSSAHMMTMLTLLVACFSQLDVVRLAPILDNIEDTPEREEVEKQTNAFLESVLHSVLPTVLKANLRLITGLIGLLTDRSNIITVVQSKPGNMLLTLFLSRVEVIKEAAQHSADPADSFSPEEAQHWHMIFDHLFQSLAPHLIHLFPSSRQPPHSPYLHSSALDVLDRPVWDFLAAFSLLAGQTQHQVLVTSLREKVLENVALAKSGRFDEEAAKYKLANVDRFLNAVGLDSSQIAM